MHFLQWKLSGWKFYFIQICSLWLSARWALHSPDNHQRIIFHALCLVKLCALYICWKIKLLLHNWQYTSIGLENGSAPNRRQDIIWTNDGLIYWHIYASLDLNELVNFFNIRQLSTSFYPSVKVVLVGRLPGTRWLWSRWVLKRGFKVDVWVQKGV